MRNLQVSPYPYFIDVPIDDPIRSLRSSLMSTALARTRLVVEFRSIVSVSVFISILLSRSAQAMCPMSISLPWSVILFLSPL